MSFLFRFCEDGVKAVHEVIDGQPNIRSNAHPFWELIFLKCNNVTYMVNGKIYHPTKNCLIITRPFTHHNLNFRPGEPYVKYLFQFTEDQLSSNICQLLPPDIDVVNFSQNQTVRDLVRKLDLYSQHFNGKTLRSLILHASEELLCNAVICAADSLSENVQATNSLILKAIDYIDENIGRPIRVDEIAQHLYITKAHLHNLFLQNLQTTPKKYIVTKKLILAQRDLRDGIKATKVYANYGFADYSTFYRHYMNHFGYSPSEETTIEIIHEHS